MSKRVLLVSANTETVNMPTMPMGMGCVAAALKERGHEVMFLDLMTAESGLNSLETALETFDPEIVGVSVRNIDDQAMENTHFMLTNCKQVVQKCKEKSAAPVVLGGAGYSIYPQAALEFLHADMGIQGEGEVSFPELADRLESGESIFEIPGLFIPEKGNRVQKRTVRNLDDLPLPSPGLFPGRLAEKSEFWLPFQTRRGCPMNCSYCSTGTIEGSLIRKRSPKAVVDALHDWVAAGYRRIYFVDNTFNLPNSYALELCNRIAEADLEIGWRCILYPGYVDKTLVAAMKKAGCMGVSLGFESGAPSILESMNKHFDVSDVRRAAELLKDYDIARMGFLLLGGPGETRQTVEKSLAFVDSLRLEMGRVSVGIRIYPGTRLARIALADGFVGPGENLLEPRFYLANSLEKWLPDKVETWMANRPGWGL